MNYTKEQKTKIFETLPEDIKEAIISVDTSDKLYEISQKYSLMLDKASELSDEVSLFMIGLTKQKDFVKNISTRLGVNMSVAEEISRDVNTKIFDSIRSSIQKIQEQNKEAPTQTPSNTAVEQAGKFTIEKDIVHNSSEQYKETNINKEELLNHIENPPTTPTVSIVDHLLANPVSNPQKVEEKKSYTVDPYREQI